MYNEYFIKGLFIADAPTYTNEDIIMPVEHEDSKKIYDFCVSHSYLEEAILEFTCTDVDVTINRRDFNEGHYNDIMELIFADYKQKIGRDSNGDSIFGIEINEQKKPFWEFVIDDKNSSLIERTGKESPDFLLSYQLKVNATHYKPVFV